jgi:hypothetical protein
MKIETIWLIMDIVGFALGLIVLGLFSVDTQVKEALSVVLILAISISRLKKLGQRE